MHTRLVHLASASVVLRRCAISLKPLTVALRRAKPVGAIALVAWPLIAARATAAEPPHYAIGSIPDQTVLHSPDEPHPLVFTLYSPGLGLSANISMSVSEAARPDGELTFDEETDLFSYLPASSDEEPFQVAFLAVGDGLPELQQITIKPIQPIPAEKETFGLEPSAPLPKDETDDKYFSYSESTASQGKYFNESNLSGMTTRSVVVAGRTIILEKGHANQIFERIHYDAGDAAYQNQDVESLVIQADRVVLRDSLHLPQTNITIRALQLVFEDRDGQTTTLSTTPLIPFGNSPPPAFGEAGFLSDANIGHKAGSLNLFVGALEAPSDAKRFLLAGGKGRAASPGKAGTKNDNTISVTSAHGYENLLSFKITFSGSYDPGTQYWPSSSDFSTRNGWGANPPSNYWGGDADEPGRPGHGGDGGDFNWTTDARSLVEAGPGSDGDKAATAIGGAGALFKRGSATYGNAWVWSGNQKLKCIKTVLFVCTDHGPDGNATTNSGYPKNVTAKAGANKPGPAANGVGSSGAIADAPTNEPFWLDPDALRYSLILLRDAYLDGHMDFAGDQLVRYLDAIETAQASDGYATIDAERRDQIDELRDEMITLKARIDSNFDYFGNPAGWVPMLSFEVNYAAFEQEIDRALRVMYVNYWLGNIASDIADRRDGMKEMQQQLLDQISQDRTDYAKAVDDIPSVRVQAEELQREIDRVIAKIKTIEEEVLKKAKQIVAAKKVARMLGKIAQTFPIGQPALGIAGGAVAAATEIDPNKSWEENGLAVGQGAAQGFAAGQAASKAGAAETQMGLINTSDSDLADDPEVRAALKNARGPLLELSKEVGGLILSGKAADPEVQAEMQRLFAQNPEFKSLKKELDKLNATKRDFANQISDLLQKITVLPIQIARNLRTISQLNMEIAAETDKLDPTTLSYLGDMNARAQERLLKYHYFMSRAYAYRRLESYQGTLNMKDIFDKIEELADQGSAEITPDQFGQLKSVYEDQISSVAEAILNEANENPSEQSVSVLFELPQSVIDQINAGEVARLNLKDLDLFPESEENLRITDLEVTAMDLTQDPDAPAPNAYSLVFKHSGISELQKDGHSYLFRHYNERTRSAIAWKSVYQFLSSMIETTKPSAASQSLIGSLVNKSPNDILIYSRPAVFADLLISSEINTTGAKVTLNSATARVSYDYTQRSEFIKYIDISPSDNGVLPEIAVSDPDISGRANAREAVQRFYDKNSVVTVTAPEALDGYAFVRWEGVGLSDPTSPTQTLTLSQNYRLQPVYAAEMKTLTIVGGSGSGAYQIGESVPIVAEPPPGAAFVRWEGGLTDSPYAPSTTASIIDDTTITAIYESSTRAKISISYNAASRTATLHISSDDADQWLLQESINLTTWNELGIVTLVEGTALFDFPLDDDHNHYFKATLPADN